MSEELGNIEIGIKTEFEKRFDEISNQIYDLQIAIVELDEKIEEIKSYVF